MMKKISKFLADNPRYRRLKKPLEAAEVCQAARLVARGRFEVISFKNALLTVSCNSSAAAGNLLAESENIISAINGKLGKQIVKKIRYKIK